MLSRWRSQDELPEDRYGFNECGSKDSEVDSEFVVRHLVSERIPGPGPYSFQFWEGEFDCARCLLGKAWKDELQVGVLSATLVPRAKGICIHSMCDAVSEELYEVGCQLLDENGRCSTELKRALRNDKERIKAVNKGGLLHVNEVHLLPNTRGQDLGLAFVLALFNHLGARWELAATCPVPCDWGDQLEEGERPGTSESAKIVVCEHFAGIGFTQLVAHDNVWILERSCVPEKPYQKASRWRAVVPQELSHLCWIVKEKGVVQPVAERIVNYLASKPSLPIPSPAALIGIEKEMADAIHDGELRRVRELGLMVDLNNMRACHRAAASQHSSVLTALLEMKAAVDTVDEAGITPLHIAASALNAEGIRILLDAHADVSTCCLSGRTPLDLVENAIAGRKKFLKAFGLESRPLGPAQREVQENMKRCQKLLKEASALIRERAPKRQKLVINKPAAKRHKLSMNKPSAKRRRRGQEA
mmetsp:Transcript_128262/g.249868  ORF Transcript_128262/g.249868 Transcript_128262/m.249868 type:complete len:474 (+) Transcript_128262:49-1470(+)